MPTTLLTATDGPAFRIIHETGDIPLILLCEHASNRVPEKLHHLGIAESDLQRHFAIDVGAGAVTERMAALLGCAAVLCNFSRLVIDCNRKPDLPAAITLQEDGVTISGNHGLSPADRQVRIDEIFVPFHTAVAQQISRLEKKFKQPPLILSIHSFTPQYRAMPLPRPWHIGIVWNTEKTVSHSILEFLRSHQELEVGNNEPYSLIPPPGVTLPTYTIEHHADAAGRSGFVVEIRNDEIVTPRGIERYAGLLAKFFSGYYKS